jgi:hypothetical protein
MRWMSASGRAAMPQRVLGVPSTPTPPRRAPLGGAAPRRRLGVFLDCSTRLRPRERDRPAARAAGAPAREQQPGCRRAEHGVPPPLPADSLLPWFVFDAGYDPVQLSLSQALGDAHAAILVRRRAGRCFYAAPTAPPRTGRPRRQGHQFACAAPQTWPSPDRDLPVDEAQDATVRVRAGTRGRGDAAASEDTRRAGPARCAGPTPAGARPLAAGRRQPLAPADPRAPSALALVAWPTRG